MAVRVNNGESKEKMYKRERRKDGKMERKNECKANITEGPWTPQTEHPHQTLQARQDKKQVPVNSVIVFKGRFYW